MENNFSVFVPIEFIKGGGTDKAGKKVPMKFKGVASTMKTGADMDGEILDPRGFDFLPLLKSGHINWNHQAMKDPMAIVGEPTSAKVIGDEFHIEGILYSDSELANKIYKAAEIMEKSGSTRKLGFSIEGNATERDKLNKKLIKKATIMNVAICPTPKNAGTAFEIVKAFEFEKANTDFSDDMIIDTINGDERVLIDSKFNIEIVKATATVIKHDDFQKYVLDINDSIEKGFVLSGIDEIKCHIATFKQALNGTIWVGGV